LAGSATAIASRASEPSGCSSSTIPRSANAGTVAAATEAATSIGSSDWPRCEDASASSVERRRAACSSVTSSNVNSATSPASPSGTVFAETTIERRPAAGVTQSTGTFWKDSPPAARTPGCSSLARRRPVSGSNTPYTEA
jgi:hypothetical protein